ncbi:unnamed protein product [Lepeophtheirus salmonis]|uniref:(salmon louse) hypothetical protein n=1 Tax=Lepeophtheirus salmonis TaxID=72036 RepID=A0A7R8H8J6_LEPSM|nr:unnamed protein product [Lepeophtheirus salmonis]CAF2943188.1 unnamed protein product [Lepeophtheirus salmonis]
MNIFYACLCLVSSFLIVIIEVESQKNSRIFVGDGIISKRSFLYHPRNIYRQRHPRRQKVQPSKPTSLQSIVHGKETPGYGRDVIRRIDYDIPPNRLLMPRLRIPTYIFNFYSTDPSAIFVMKRIYQIHSLIPALCLIALIQHATGFAVSGRQSQLAEQIRYDLHSRNDPLLSYLKPNPDEALLYDLLKVNNNKTKISLTNLNDDKLHNDDEPSLESLLDDKKNTFGDAYNLSQIAGLDLKDLIEKVTGDIVNHSSQNYTPNSKEMSKEGINNSDMNLQYILNRSQEIMPQNISTLASQIFEEKKSDSTKFKFFPCTLDEPKNLSEGNMLSRLLKDRLNHEKPDSLLETILRSTPSQSRRNSSSVDLNGPFPRRALNDNTPLSLANFFTQIKPGPSPYWAPLLSASKTKRSAGISPYWELSQQIARQRKDGIKLNEAIIHSLKQRFQKFLIVDNDLFTRKRIDDLMRSNSTLFKSILSDILRKRNSETLKYSPAFYVSNPENITDEIIDRRARITPTQDLDLVNINNDSDWLTAKDILYFYRNRKSSPAIIVPILEKPNILFREKLGDAQKFQSDTISEIVQNLHEKSKEVKESHALNNRQLLELYNAIGSITNSTAASFQPFKKNITSLFNQSDTFIHSKTDGKSQDENNVVDQIKGILNKIVLNDEMITDKLVTVNGNDIEKHMMDHNKDDSIKKWRLIMKRQKRTTIWKRWSNPLK